MTDSVFEYPNGTDAEGKNVTLRVLIKPMNEFQAENWLMRAGFLLGEKIANKDMTNIKDVKGLVQAICAVGFEKAKPLLDELLDCCYLANGNLTKPIRQAGAGVVKSPLLLMRLRIDAAKVNFGFLLSGDASAYLSGVFTEPRP